MKATLTFSLPEERDEFRMASKSADVVAVLRDLDEALRSVVKYGAEAGMPGLKADQAERVREWLRHEIQDAGITEVLG